MAVEDFLEQITLEDVSSHIYEIYSHPKSQDLGIRSRSQRISISLDDDHEFEFTQSLTSLNSKGSTTGYVLWKLSVPFIQWLLRSGLYDFQGKNVIELGSGVTGLFACCLGPRCKHYIATDHQQSLLRLLQKNIESNLVDFDSSTLDLENKGRRLRGRVDVIEFDWEDLESASWNLEQITQEPLDYVIACDVVYNDYLIPFLVDAIDRVSGPQTVILIGLQLRLPENIEQFVRELLERGFKVWRHLENCLTQELCEGFVMYQVRKTLI